MKRILMLNYEFPPLGGGAATATENLLKELSKEKDMQVDLVTSSAGAPAEGKFADNVRIFYLDIGKSEKNLEQGNKELLTYAWKSWKFCRKLKKENKYDLIHAFFGIPSGFVAMMLGIPYIVSLRGSDVPFYNKKYRWLDILFFQWLSKIIWARAKRVIANSEGLKQLALKIKKDQEIEVIYNGVDVATFHPTFRDENIFTVISTSRMTSRKRLDLLARSFVKFAKGKGDVKLVFAGDGPMKKELEEIVGESEQEEKVVFLGAVDRKETPGLYQKSDVFVLPSVNEGMSNSLLEAMASGLAVIVTDTGGTKELVSEENGIIVQMDSEEEILQGLEKLYTDRTLLEKFKGQNRKKAETLSWEKMKDGYLEIYNEIK